MKRIIKFFSVLLTGLALVFSFCFFMIPEITEKSFVMVSAEENSEEAVRSVSSDFDLSKYPSANLIPFPYTSKSQTINGITFTINSDGSVTLSGSWTGPESSISDFSLCSPFSLPVGNYFLSGCPSGGGSYSYRIFLFFSGASSIYISDTGSGISFSVTESISYNLVIRIGSDIGTVDNLVFYPMINQGSIAYPYQPYIPNLIQQGYDEGEQAGHDSGYQSGYDQGVADTSDTLDLGVFRNCTFSAVLTYGDDSVINVTDFVPGFTYNSVLTKKLWDSYMVKPGDDSVYLETCELTINFVESFNYATFPVYFSGSSVVTDATFIDSSGNRYSAQITPWQSEQALAGDYYRILVSDTNVSTFQVTSLTVRFGRASDTLENGVFSAMSGSYLVGYDSGYNSGLVDGKSEGLSQGREEGYQSGYDSGYDSGYATGKADAFGQINNSSLAESVRAFLFSLFDAPVSTFLGAFNFSWDAFDIGSLVAFIFTMIVIIGFVKVWL